MSNEILRSCVRKIVSILCNSCMDFILLECFLRVVYSQVNYIKYHSGCRLNIIDKWCS